MKLNKKVLAGVLAINFAIGGVVVPTAFNSVENVAYATDSTEQPTEGKSVWEFDKYVTDEMVYDNGFKSLGGSKNPRSYGQTEVKPYYDVSTNKLMARSIYSRQYTHNGSTYENYTYFSDFNGKPAYYKYNVELPEKGAIYRNIKLDNSTRLPQKADTKELNQIDIDTDFYKLYKLLQDIDADVRVFTSANGKTWMLWEGAKPELYFADTRGIVKENSRASESLEKGGSKKSAAFDEANKDNKELVATASKPVVYTAKDNVTTGLKVKEKNAEGKEVYKHIDKKQLVNLPKEYKDEVKDYFWIKEPNTSKALKTTEEAKLGLRFDDGSVSEVPVKYTVKELDKVKTAEDLNAENTEARKRYARVDYVLKGSNFTKNDNLKAPDVKVEGKTFSLSDWFSEKLGK